MDPQKSIFWTAQLRVPVFYDISRDLTDKYFDIVWRCHPRGPPNAPSKINFWMAQARVQVFCDIRRYLTDKFFDSTFWRFHNQVFLNNCWFDGRQEVLLSVTALATRRSFTGFAGKLPTSYHEFFSRLVYWLFWVISFRLSTWLSSCLSYLKKCNVSKLSHDEFVASQKGLAPIAVNRLGCTFNPLLLNGRASEAHTRYKQ